MLQDDGSLAFLNIPRDENSRSFNCEETNQSKLVNTEFWVIDFITDVPTKFSRAKGTKGQTLHDAKGKIENYLTSQLNLRMKGNWQIFKIAQNRQDKSGRALDYVGYKFYMEHTLIRKSIKQNFCRTCAKLNKKKDISVKDYKQGIASWLGLAKHSNSKNLLKKTLKKEVYESIL